MWHNKGGGWTSGCYTEPAPEVILQENSRPCKQILQSGCIFIPFMTKSGVFAGLLTDKEAILVLALPS